LNKKTELLTLVQEKEPDIIAVTEAIAKNQKCINATEYSIPGYDLFVNKNPKRGITIYAKSEMNVTECEVMNNTDFEECLWITFKTPDAQKTLFGCVYKSPNTTLENEEMMLDLLKRDYLQQFDYVCITGDFNFPDINWTGTWTGERNGRFITTLLDSFLIQVVKQPTRRREGQIANILDLVIVNDELLVSDIIHFSPLGKSDHEVLIFDLYVKNKIKRQEDKMIYNIKKANFHEMKNDIRKINCELLKDLTVEKCWEEIKLTIQKSMEKNIPKKKVKENKKQKPSWMNKKTMKFVKKKYNLYKKFLISKNGRDYQKYIETRNACTKEIKKVKREFEKKLSKECKLNPKCFWKYVNSQTKINSGVSLLRAQNGDIATTDAEKAETLNTFFGSVFTKENTDNIPNTVLASLSNEKTVNNVEITEEMVKKRLSSLNTDKAQGPDGIPAKVLKELCEELAKPLTILFTKSIEHMTIPTDWKNATVIPIFKKGTRTDPGNYRPVSLTCILCKILESFIRDAIVDHMTNNSLYADCQHGFRKHRSCMTQLLEVMEDFTQWIDCGENIDVLYLDFSKAFDTVPHERLIKKMEAYGITGKVLGWTRNFLTERTQRVKVGNQLSGMADVISGIPQGSILGPVLFTIFINDLPTNLNSTCKIFADDTKLYNTPTNNDAMQTDINVLVEWSDTWNLYFNANKCKVLHIGSSNPEKDYVMKNDNKEVNITKCKEEKDLGVFFDTSLSFDQHINKCINKANQRIGIIKRTFSYLDKDVFLQLYKSLVRPILEYGNVIWFPRLIRQSADIEGVQRRATKLIYDIKELSYEERLKFLNLPSLKARRVRGDLIQTYKIFNKVDDIDTACFFDFPITNITRNSTDKIQKKHYNTNLRKYSFSNRVIDLWNKLTTNIKRAPSVNAFKNLIDSHNIYKNIQYDFDGRK
jgi:hypothetical protein